MDDLIRQEKSCRHYCNEAIKWLCDTYDDTSNLFHVSFRNNVAPTKTLSPNGATSIIGRIVMNCNESAADHIEIENWSRLHGFVEKSQEAVLSSRLEHALPLKTMGILPLFTVCYLAEYLSSTKSPLSHGVFAITIRVILSALHKEFGIKKVRYIKVDKLHPYVLYRIFKVIDALYSLLEKASRDDKNIIKVFKKNLFEEKYILAAIKLKYDGNIPDEKEFNEAYGIEPDLKSLKTYINHIINNFDSDTGIKHIFSAIEDRALHEAMTQIFKSGKDELELDPSALAFSIGILAKTDVSRHYNVISKGINILIESCKNGAFVSSLPFKIDDKGRAIYVPSVEVANISTIICLKLLERGEAFDIDNALKFTKLIYDRICESELSVNPKNAKVKRGWCTDKAPSYNRIDSWVIALTIAFFIRRLELLRLAKRKIVLKQYSWVPSKECKPEWSEITEPDLGFRADGLKKTIMNVIDEKIQNREIAPIFLLYGPPGTSKTTIAQGVARQKGWDLITLSPSDFISDSLDHIEMRSRDIFKNLENVDKCVILFDEIDSLLRDREEMQKIDKVSIMQFVVPAILPKLQRLRDYVCKNNIAVFIVTNYYERIDKAILRSGRIDNHLLVLPFSKEAKMDTLARFVKGKWKEGDTLSTDGRKAADIIFKKCNPLIGYREIEQIGKTIMKSWENPLAVDGTKVDNLFCFNSISPETYDAKDRKGAIREVYAIVNRILGQYADMKVILSLSKPDIQEYLRKSVSAIQRMDMPDGIRIPWSELAECWSKKAL